jgi:glutamine synthetase
MFASDVLKTIKDNDVKFIDLRFTDPRGQEHHTSVPVGMFEEDVFEDGQPFDGSSINGWKGINASDMLLMPDASTAVLDPFTEESTLNLRCNIVEPDTMEGYERDPRSVAIRAEAYLTSTGIADTAYFGPEPEFFVFDEVRWKTDMSGMSYSIDAEEASWNSNKKIDGGNTGHRPGVKGGYFPVPPVDSLNDLRATMCLVMEQMGVLPEVHHHEVGTAGQCEIGTRFDTLVKRADGVQILKYVVQNVAHQYGKTATFMPKPIVGDNGSGMHVHQSLAKAVTIFSLVSCMVACQKLLCTTSAVSSSTHVQSMHFQMPLPIVTNAWYRVLKHLSCWLTRRVTALLQFVSRMWRIQKAVV